MKKLCFLLVLLILVSTVNILAADEEIAAEPPVVVTTCGQSPGALMVRMLCQRVNLECDQKDLLTAEDLKNKAETGEGYKTLIVTMGTSGKGMGAAGTDMNAEEKRIEEVIAEARNQGMLVIGAHIEGMARRVDENDARSVKLVTPKSDLLIIKNDSNPDGYFTDKAEEMGVPIYLIEKNLDLADTLKEIFKL